MFFVLCKPDDYYYEIYQIIKIYYPDEKVIDALNMSDIPNEALIIKNEVLKLNEGIICESRLLQKKLEGYTELKRNIEQCDIGEDEKKSVKHCIKLSVFKLLKDYTGIEAPWGILVGIRPSKIVNELKSNGAGNEDIHNILKNNYLLSDEKIDLITKISDLSYGLINRDPKNVSIYIGIPFCPTVCVYCSFASYPISLYKDYINTYIAALDYEISKTAQFLNRNFNVESIYIGGGTPTSIDDGCFERLLRIVYRNFNIKDIKEYTVEAGRPDTINLNKLNAMKSYGVNRISINPQSMNDDTLKRIGRRHSVDEIIQKFYMARDVGFNNINMDMILALPGEGLEHVKHTIDEILKLSPESITVHTMAIKRASRLRNDIIENRKMEIPDAYIAQSMMDYVVKIMDMFHYQPYYMYRQKMMVGNLENVGYCKRGFECLYNIQMIEEKETIIGFGADSVTKTVFLDQNRIERVANKKDVKQYIDSIYDSTDKKIEALKLLVEEEI